jgi:hypothetical protein
VTEDLLTTNEPEEGDGNREPFVVVTLKWYVPLSPTR